MEQVDRKRQRKPNKPSAVAIQRRNDLKEAAIRCISERGYAAVTTAMICDDGGFSRGLIGHYFKGKDELMLEAISQSTSRLRESTRRAMEVVGSDPYHRLHAMVRSSFAPPGFTPNQAAVRTALAGNAKWSTLLGDKYRELWQDYRAGISHLFEQAAAQRHRPLNGNAAALLLSRAIEGFWTGWVANPTMHAIAESESACHALVDLLLDESSPIPKRV